MTLLPWFVSRTRQRIKNSRRRQCQVYDGESVFGEEMILLVVQINAEKELFKVPGLRKFMCWALFVVDSLTS